MQSRLLAAMLAALPLAAGSAVFPAAALAEAPAMTGPAVGSPAVYGALQTSDGAAADMAALAGEKGTVIAFFRSADWCPFCKKQLKELEDAKAPLTEQGWNLVAISYDAPETLAAFAGKNSISYPLLSDPGSETIKAFNLLNTDMKPGSRTYGIPYPAIVFVGADGTVKTVLQEEGYKVRPTNEAVIEAAAALQ